MEDDKKYDAKSKMEKFTNRLIIGMLSITVIIIGIVVIKLAQIML